MTEVIRSLLFTPGHRPGMVEKAQACDADAIILDLEDGVPWPEKPDARLGIAAALARRQESAGPIHLVRVNGGATGLLEADLEAIVTPGIDGVVLPKVESGEQVADVDRRLDALEGDVGVAPGSIRLLAAIESAKGLNRVLAIAAASQRLVGLVFGAEDFALDLGLPVRRSAGGQDLVYARSRLVIAAAEARIQAIDQVWTEVHDLDGLRGDSIGARALGFSGKCLIHPGQIAVVNDVFRPTVEELELARRIVTAFEEARAKGIGATMLGGQLVELPIVERALRMLRLDASLPLRQA